MKATFGQAHLLERAGAGGHHLDGVGVGHAHILAGKDQHAPEDEARRLAGIDHLRHPVDGRIRVAAAQALDKGADGVEVVVALLVIEDGAALDRLLGDVQRHVDDGRRARVDGVGGLHSQFQRVEHAARIAVGDVDQMVERVLVDAHVAGLP